MNFLNFTPEQWAMGVGALIPVGVLWFGAWKDRRELSEATSDPQSERLLRPPGHSLSAQLGQAGDSLLNQLLIATAVGALAGLSVEIAVRWWAQAVPTSWSIGATIVAGCLTALGVLRIRELFNLIETMRTTRLGLRGEQAVAEALQELASAGYRSFHDVPGQEIRSSNKPWNIDHVLVGSRGVYAVETKARRRRKGNKKVAPHQVNVANECLGFASGHDTEAIPQAKRNARDLGAYLTKRTGEKVAVDWLVVLPGYYVKADEDNAAHVMNAKYLVRFLADKPERIAPAQVRRITAVLDEKCRDIEF